MALAGLALALAVPTAGSAAPLSPEAIRGAVEQTSPVESVAHCRRTSYGGCYRRYRTYYYVRPRYRAYRVYRPRYRVYRVY